MLRVIAFVCFQTFQNMLARLDINLASIFWNHFLCCLSFGGVLSLPRFSQKFENFAAFYYGFICVG